MDVILLYGPPGVGKQSIANALSERTGYPVFPNHLTLDAVHTILPRGHPEAPKALHQYRIWLTELAVRTGCPGLLHTIVYKLDESDAYVYALRDTIAPAHGCLFPIQLFCSQDVLERRLVDPSRSDKKIKSVDKLNDLRGRAEIDKPIPYLENLVLDNSLLSIPESANVIIEWCKLPIKNRS